MSTESEGTYLGFDLSTQQLKAIVLNEDLCIQHQTTVVFESELPEFRTRLGLLQGKDPRNFVAPVLMWVKALDMVMDKLRVCGVDFSKVIALSGCAQQHGAVYWNIGAMDKVQSLQSDTFLHEQLADCFAIKETAVWLDCTTQKWCQIYDDAVGGPEELAILTGSRAFERFTGPQILKVEETNPAAYSASERITLVSNFLCSIFLGKYANIDYADASGMNLMNIVTKKWDETLLKLHSPDLVEKLGDPVSTHSKLGTISPYFVERFGFDPLCSVIAFTGDNPSCMIGLQVEPGDIVVSLGTSDTVLTWITEPYIAFDGHIMCNPLVEEAYMGMVCYKNGARTRERICNMVAKGDWNTFSLKVKEVPMGNHGNIGLYFDLPEIKPSICGDYRFNSQGERLTSFARPEIEARALWEGQCIAKRHHLTELGVDVDGVCRVLATGGASKNATLVQILADTWNAPVYYLDASNAALLGAGFKAKYGHLLGKKPLEEITKKCPGLLFAAMPCIRAKAVYSLMLERYAGILDELCDENSESEEATTSNLQK